MLCEDTLHVCAVLVTCCCVELDVQYRDLLTYLFTYLYSWWWCVWRRTRTHRAPRRATPWNNSVPKSCSTAFCLHASSRRFVSLWRCGRLLQWCFDLRFPSWTRARTASVLLISFYFSIFPLIFTARRYASAVHAVIVCPSVCLSVCHTPVLYQKAKRKSTQTTPYDSPETSFLLPKMSAKFRRGHPQRWRQIEVIFDQYLVISQKRGKMKT